MLWFFNIKLEAYPLFCMNLKQQNCACVDLVVVYLTWFLGVGDWQALVVLVPVPSHHENHSDDNYQYDDDGPNAGSYNYGKLCWIWRAI